MSVPPPETSRAARPATRPTILTVDDDPSARSIVRKALAPFGYGVGEVGEAGAALAEVKRLQPVVVLLDLFLPEPCGIDLLKEITALPAPPSVIVITGHAEHTYVMEAMRWGAYDYVVKPFDIDRLRGVVKQALSAAAKNDRPAAAGAETERAAGPPLVVSRSEAMREVFKLAGRAASSDETVLITGESGVGKEVVARSIHEHSACKAGPFVSVNCAAIPAGLVEAELFGYERGAFTGADRARAGKFAAAQSGTLFLDEVGELPLEAQAKFLRVLQDREVTPLGSSRSQKVNVRVVCATNQNLRERVETSRFREDLYYRLAVFELGIPPLRERREDLSDLIRTFTSEVLAEYHLQRGGLSAAAEAALGRYDFPGNVRELRNLVRKLIAVHRDRPITPDLLPAHVRGPASEPISDWRRNLAEHVRESLAGGETGVGTRVRHGVEDILVREALTFAKGNQVKAAELIGIHRNTLRRKRRSERST
ncbi:MAG: sigma-54-dependent Fis family transcriptional regulator [Nitrospirae bacterium]|nr:sigma-54-dependent Fis family transcriptional regulator [Nitrospirota bacterium]